jgi:hypothetical protein
VLNVEELCVSSKLQLFLFQALEELWSWWAWQRDLGRSSMDLEQLGF